MALINKPTLIICDISIDAVDASIIHRAQGLMKHIQCQRKKEVRNVISSVLYQTLQLHKQQKEVRLSEVNSK